MRADAKKNYDHILAVAREAFAAGGAEASLRDIARTAEVGMGTLYRHFPTREALLEVILRERFEALAASADTHAQEKRADAALVSWLREIIAFTHQHSGVLGSMAAAIDDPASALHGSCVSLKAAGARLLARAQDAGEARRDLDGVDLFALISASAWLYDQPAFAPRAGHLFEVIAGAILAPAKA